MAAQKATPSRATSQTEKSVIQNDSPGASQAPAAVGQQSAAPASGQSAGANPIEALQSDVTRDAAPAEQAGDFQPQSPRQRVPFGSFELKLDLPPRPGFHRHWFNDKPGRIERAELAGYTHVCDASGKPISRPVGVRDGGGALHAFVMEIPQELYDEDFLRAQARVNDIDASIRQGKLATTEGDSRYVPKATPIRIEYGKDSL
jgi:hypothetical protein